MELELRKERFSCFEESAQITHGCALSAETIVPDYCPDIERIVAAESCLLLRSCEAAEGEVRVSGTLRMSVLYVPQGERRLRALHYALPVEAAFEARLNDGCAQVCVRGEAASVEVRAVNPRKLFTTAALTLTARPYCRTELALCSAVEGAEEHGVQLLRRTQELSLICAVQEREFPFTDEVALPAAREGVREILLCCAEPRLTESRCVGGKVLLKGVLHTQLLYTTESEGVETFSAQLPFSWVLDGAEGASDAEVNLRLAELQTRVSADDTRTVTLTAVVAVCAALRRTASASCIVDLYGIGEEPEAKTRPLTFTASAERLVRQVAVRETVETGSEVRSVLHAGVSFAPVAVTREGGALTLRTTAEVRLLFLDEEGSFASAHRRIDLSARAEAPEDAAVRAAARCTDDISCVNALGGVELRFPVELSAWICREGQLPGLVSLQTHPRPAEDGPVPSLILRERGESSLWSLAKACRTTVDDILRANELESEADAPAQGLLLIPRRR